MNEHRNQSILRTLLRVAALALLALVFVGCSPGGDSPQDLVRSFVSNINSRSYGSIQSLLDSGATSYSTANTSAYWTTYFKTDDEPYGVAGLSGDGPVTATVSTGSGNRTITFTFSGSEGNLFNDSDYKIRTIEEGNTPIFN
mgnify:CR=1 FL=1